MSTKIICVLVGLAFALALPGGLARADDDGGDGKIVVAVDEIIGFEPGTPECEEGIITFSLVPRDSGPGGIGTSCIHSTAGCTFAAGCRATIDADFTFTFPQGSLTAPMVLKEVWTADTFVRQRASGRISSGTGAFTGATGSIKCRGSIEFTDAGVIPDLVCTVRTKRQDD